LRWISIPDNAVCLTSVSSAAKTRLVFATTHPSPDKPNSIEKMKETYNLAAIPFLFSDGEFKGHLKGVTFIATSTTDTKQWFTINCGQFETAFCKLIPSTLAKEIIAVLIRGDGIEFPGLYQKEQFDHGFNYEWSPVHFERAPLIGPGHSMV
jgi:hypothetical protein